MRLYVIFYLFSIFFLNIVGGYVLRSKVNGNRCEIDFRESILYIKWDKNICNNVEYSKFNLFKFNDCDSFKKYIKGGIELWKHPNIKTIYDIDKNDIDKKKIEIMIKFGNLNENKIAEAYRKCHIKLLYGSISLNRRRCFYPDNFFCQYMNVLFIFLFILCIMCHIFIFILGLYLLNIEETSYHFLYILFIFIIDFAFLIYIYINCTKCSSLKNVIGHEFGHILGFAHPDQNYYLNWVGNIKNCVVEKTLNRKYDINSIMLSNNNNLRFIKSISNNDNIGLYDLYPTCNYSLIPLNNFEYINENNKSVVIVLISYIVISFIGLLGFFIYSKMRQNVRVNSFSG